MDVKNSIYTICIAILTNTMWVDCSQFKQPQVKIENGILIGKYSLSRYGTRYLSFEGIPYAKPPVDDKRFMEPEPLRGTWLGVWNATQPGSPCLQYNHVERTRNDYGGFDFLVMGDEDCLFLNVYTKDVFSNQEVIFLIHGGGFTFGSSDAQGPEYIMDVGDVVVVTINYRLGPLGFLTTGDSLSPGNNGLKDQTLALEWVQRNIAAFGGNPGSVTLVGMSAGGASVQYHFLSHRSEGLFHRGYSFSGSVLCPWAFVTDGVEKTHQLATYMGCPTTDSKTMLKCLRRRPARNIVKQFKNFQNWMFNPFTVFGPVAEVNSSLPFLEVEPRKLLEQGRIQDLPWIVGFTIHEGLYPAADFIEDDGLLKELEENWSSVAPSLLFYKERSENNRISNAVKEHYFGNKAISTDTAQELLRLISDRNFIAPITEAAFLQSLANSQSVYLYTYEHEGTTSISQMFSPKKSVLGVSHGDDFAYIFKLGRTDSHVQEEDKTTSHFLIEILLGFAEQEIPPSSLNWKPLSRKNTGQVQRLRISSANNVHLENQDIGFIQNLKDLFDDSTAVRDEL